MATKLSPFKNATGTLKLGERNAEVRAVGAWVEPEYYNRRTIFEAVVGIGVDDVDQIHFSFCDFINIMITSDTVTV